MKKGIDRNTIISMAGIGVSLLALVIIFSQNTIFSFLTKAIVLPFGFVGFWILLPFLFILGLYMLLKQKIVRFKIGLSLWGLLIIIIALLILTSSWSESALVPDGEFNFGTLSPTYINALTELTDNPYDTRSGGGLVGYFIAACLYSAITKIGAQIVAWLLVVLGLCLVFNLQIKKIYSKIKNRKSGTKVQSSNYEEESHNTFEEIKDEEVPNLNPSVEVASTPEVNEKNLADLEIRNYNNTHSLKRAEFSTEDDEDLDVLPSASFRSSSAFSSPTFGVEEEFKRPSLEPIANSQPKVEETDEVTNDSEQYTSDEIIEESVQEIDESNNVEKVVTPVAKPQPKINFFKNYIYPPLDLLDYHEDSDDASKNEASTQDTIERINSIFQQLHIGAEVVGATVGPAVTRYDIKTNLDVSVNVVERYKDDIAIRLGGVSARFERLVAGKSTSGLEVPNAVRTTVGLRESIEKLPTGPKFLKYIPFGKNISGELVNANLCDFPHMLVSGTTGSGKTIFMHSVILTLLMRNKPDELKLVLIDPKKVEMSYYEKIPHLLCPNISNSNKAYVAMKKLVDEMERRYNLFAENRVRDIKGYNEYAKGNNLPPLPYIVVFVDEYADLVEEVKDIKAPVVRIAQKARAAGIHLVIATQRPSVNVIDGVIKANISVRAALMVASQTDSISILGEAGAEKLLGNGDMIVDCSLISRSMKPRVQGCFVDIPEINRVCDFLRNRYPEQYDPEFLDLEEHEEVREVEEGVDVGINGKGMSEEELYETIKEDLADRDYCSISYIQRTYAVGFPKAGRLFNKLIKDGYVARGGDARGSKVLIRNHSEQQMGTIEQSTFIPDEGNEDNNTPSE